MSVIAALYVARDGAYFVDGIDPWDEARDARGYAGPWPVVAHPPCQRWGRFWHGSPSRPHQFALGDDEGCFAAALAAVRRFGGVLEHPEGSRAWGTFGLRTPTRKSGWIPADDQGGWTCCVYQGKYGHFAGKATWLYAVSAAPLPELRWGPVEQRLDPEVVARLGYEKARRRGMISATGGGGNPHTRNATPPEFRDLLVSIAKQAQVHHG